MISALSMIKDRFLSCQITNPKRSSSRELSRSESWARFQRRLVVYLLISLMVMNCGNRWSLNVSWICMITMADSLVIQIVGEINAENSSLLWSLPRNWTIFAHRSPFLHVPSPARPSSSSESSGSIFSSCLWGSTSSGSCQSHLLWNKFIWFCSWKSLLWSQLHSQYYTLVVQAQLVAFLLAFFVQLFQFDLQLFQYC